MVLPDSTLLCDKSTTGLRLLRFMPLTHAAAASSCLAACAGFMHCQRCPAVTALHNQNALVRRVWLRRLPLGLSSRDTRVTAMLH